MENLDLLKLDREVARAARAERAWWRLLDSDVDAAAATEWYEPLRHLTTRTTVLALHEVAASDPLREPLLRWVHRLALTRIAARTAIDVARAWQQPSLELEVPERATLSPKRVLHRALADREAARASAWLRALGEAGPSLLAAERRHGEAVVEISKRLGIADPSSLRPFDRGALSTEAERFLAGTDTLVSSLVGDHEELGEALALLVAREVPGVWPRRADARWLFDQFDGTPLLEGLALDLGPTPATLGASSFARSLARFGAAYARAAVLGAGAFALASDPSDAHPLRRGALFAGLVADPIFLRKRLGFSRDAARRTARALAPAMLAALRLDAARALVDFAQASQSEIEEASSVALGVRVAPDLAGALPRPDARAPARLAGALLAHDDREAMKARFDEDWFENPHALSFLREIDASPRALSLPKEALEGAADRIARAIEMIAG